MFEKLYLALSGAIFFGVSMVHLYRLYVELPLIIGNYTLPLWASYAGFPVSLALSIWAYLIFSRRTWRW